MLIYNIIIYMYMYIHVFQVPQYLHEAGWTANGFTVGITQPRRVAATTVCCTYMYMYMYNVVTGWGSLIHMFHT